MKRKTNSTIEQLKFKNHEKRDRILISKYNLFIRFSGETNVLPSDQVFSNWVNFVEKTLLINCA